MAGAGFEAMITAGPLPTPVVAFGIRHFGCVAGVVVTASHNPPQDNGYKVYLGDGSQIVPPADAEIAARIDEVAEPRSGRRARGRTATRRSATSWSRPTSTGSPAWCRPRPRGTLDWVYTPLHGVGGAVVDRAVARSRLPGRRRWCAEQAEPDPDFPTVAFPNPEEPGAIDLALAEAQRSGRRPGGGQRPGRRPLRGGRRDRRGLADAAAATSSGRCSATTRCAGAYAGRTPARSSPARCWRRWPRRTGSRSPTP